MKKALFIINPIAGTRSKKDIPLLIKQGLDKNKFIVDLAFTEKADHATALAQEAVVANYDLVVAVGGDGTINEVARGLVNTPVALGIIPMGSGNGLARHLQIPMNVKQAINKLNHYHALKIDTGRIDGHLFLCTAGVGFDAKVSHEFSKEKIRGFFTYFRIAMNNFLSASASSWEIEIDGRSETVEGLLLTIANANQYGNNVFIAPQAQIQDGEFDVCVLKNFSFYNSPLVLKDIFNKTLHKNRFYSLRKGKQLVIKNEGEIEIHYDGEPMLVQGDIKVDIQPLSLNVFAD